MKPLFFALSGAVGGLIVGSGASMRWGVDWPNLAASPNFATLLAGLGGAGLGAVISFFIAERTHQKTLARDETARKEHERALAMSALITTLQLSSRAFTLRGKLRAAVNNTQGLEPWQVLMASTGQSHQAPRYSAEDFVPFINAGGADVVHRALLLADRVDSLEAGYNKYGELRTDLEASMAPYSRILDNGKYEAKVPPELDAVFHYNIGRLRKLIAEMSEFSERDVVDAQNLLKDMLKAYRSYFGALANFDIELVVDEDATDAKGASDVFATN